MTVTHRGHFLEEIPFTAFCPHVSRLQSAEALRDVAFLCGCETRCFRPSEVVEQFA